MLSGSGIHIAMKNIAIIGAGLSGLVLGKRLREYANVTIFEKSRGVSGRLATRTIGDYEFDHGAQFLTSRSKAFKKFLAPYIESGYVTEWLPHVITLEADRKFYTRPWFEPHFVGSPAMTSLCKKLAEDQNIEFQVHISELTQGDNGWLLQAEDLKIETKFDWVISTAPAPQTRELLGGFIPEELLSGEGGLDSVQMSPCFCLMLGFKSLHKLPFDAARVKRSPIEWIMLNSSKAGRRGVSTLVVQTSNDWAKENLERPQEYIMAILLAELRQLLPESLTDHDVISLQRWRYSRVEKPMAQDYLLDTETRLAACGDWAVEGRVEGAFTSAERLANVLEPRL